MGSARTWDGVDELYRRHVPSLKRLAFLISDNAEFAEDAVHEAFLNVVAKHGTTLDPEHLKAYLRRAVINEVRSTWRSHVRRLTRQGTYTQRTPDVVEPVDPHYDPALQAALNTLNATGRAVLVLTFYDDASDAQIADALGCAVGTVKSARSRALAALRKEYRHDTGTPDATPTGRQERDVHATRQGR